MIPRSIRDSWNNFFFKPEQPTPIALFRILFGLLNVANLALAWPEWLTWYGPHAFMSMDTMSRMAVGPRINLFTLLPQTDFAVYAFFWFFLACAAFLTVGYMTRFSSVAVYLCLMSVQQRNVFVLNGADTIMMITGFFLMFSPAGGALSIDRLRRIRQGREGWEVPSYSPWAQRMIQIQMSVGYLSTFSLKMAGKAWRNGTAVYYALHLNGFRRFPVPFSNWLGFIRAATWGTLAVEFSAGALVWFRRLRYAVLLAALLMHMSIEYAMNLPLFEWMMVSTYVTFLYPEDLSRWWRRIAAGIGPKLGPVAEVHYDAESPATVRDVNVLRAVDVFTRLQFLERSPGGSPDAQGIREGSTGWDGVRFETETGSYKGLAGLQAIAPLVPLLWPLLLRRSARTVLTKPASAKE